MNTVFELKLKNNKTLYLNPEDERAKTLIRTSGEFNAPSKSTWRHIYSLSTWDYIIDVGANYGEMLLAIDIPKETRVLCYEPNPNIVENYLSKTIEKVNNGNYFIKTCALSSNKSNNTTFYLDETWSGTSGLKKDASLKFHAGINKTKEIKIKTTTLDDEIESKNLNILIKIDVEGSELNVIDGAIKTLANSKSCFVMFEALHLDYQDLIKIQALLPEFKLYAYDARDYNLKEIPLEKLSSFNEFKIQKHFNHQDYILEKNILTTKNPPSKKRKKYAVYTALIGDNYEELNKNPFPNDEKCDFYCFTNIPTLKSEKWNIVQVDPYIPRDNIRSARYIKIMGPLLLGGYDASLWVDNSISLKLRPSDILDEWLRDDEIALPDHSFRISIAAEFDAVETAGFDDPARIYEQLITYSNTDPNSLLEKPYATGILARRHTEKIFSFMLRWWSHVLRFSRRDQLSFNYTAKTEKISPRRILIDNHSSRYHYWPAIKNRNRSLTSEKITSCLRIPIIELGALQNEITKRDRTISALLNKFNITNLTGSNDGVANQILAARNNVENVETISDTSSDSNSLDPDQRYSLWLNRTSPREVDTQLLAERMFQSWTKRPSMQLLMALHRGEESLLADTLDSLAAQLYPNWLLTVVTGLVQPEGCSEIPNLQWLSLKDASHIDYVIDEVAAASAGTWLARIEPGLTFEPHALQVFADYINARPMWHLMYCDEDTREADGRFTQPLFKPDLNLDLLRAQSYFGAFVLVEKEAFNVVGRYGAHRGAENYDLSLRILDQVGPQSIGHIDQMLVHLPRESTRAMEPEAEKRAVVDHLQRRGLEAEVCEGLAPGTRHVEYRWPAAPLVSIVIQTRDREEYLRPMLESLHELTAYPNYELIIVDNDTQDPDAVDWLRTLPDDPRWRGRAKVLPASGPFNWAAGANAGARAARGDFLLFLDNDMHIVQPEWLSRLMSTAQRPEVGIVGPRLAFAETARVQETGWVLGLYGLASSPWKKDMELTDPGYMGRAVCDQEVGAVSGSALLVRSSVFSDVGGLDATSFPVFEAALDLCLRVREQGKSVVCTPYSMIVHYGGVSMHERQKEPGCALEDLLARKAERETILSRWLHRLANDPTYNKNLSLIEPFEPEHIAPLTWDTHFRERTRILGIPLSGGAGEYRLRAPLKAISRAGLAQTMICEPPAPKTVRILTPVEFARIDPDVIIFHQPVDDLQTESLKNLAKYLPGVRRIITIDDLITAVPKKNSFHKFGFKDAKPRLRKTLSLAERVVVSTEPLADFCRGLIDDIRIMPNCLEQAIWNGAAPPRSPRCKPRVGWAGAQQHLGDLELIYPVVEALANEVDWIFMGMCPDPLRPFVREFHDFVRDFEAYPSKLAQLDLDLAIAPLEINAFNEAKSNLRLLEYGFMGWPVICTDIFPYQSAPVTRLPNDPERWISAIREQVADPAALERSGQALQEWVLANFILEDHATEWAAAYGR